MTQFETGVPGIDGWFLDENGCHVGCDYQIVADTAIAQRMRELR